MKKIIGIFLVTFSVSFSETFTLDSMIATLKTKGVQNEYKEIQIDKDKVQRKKTEHMYRDGVNLKVTPSHQFDYDPIKKDEDTSTAQVSYDFLSVGVYDMKDGADTWVGIDKNLKDIIYSEKKSRLKILDLTEEKNKNINAKNIDKEIIELIEHYKNYTNTVEYLKFLNTQETQYKSEFEIINQAYKDGSKTKLDRELAKVKFENIKAEIVTVEDELDKLREDFKLVFRIPVTESDELIPLDKSIENIDLKISSIGKRDLENIELDQKINSEKINYSKYNNEVPDLDFSTKYMIQKKEWVISLAITKKFFSFDDITATNKLDLEKTYIDKDYMTNKTESLRSENMITYKKLKKKIENIKRDLKVKKLEMEVFNEKFKNGSETYSDYIEKRREYEKAYVDYIKDKNELQSFVYELDYKL